MEIGEFGGVIEVLKNPDRFLKPACSSSSVAIVLRLKSSTEKTAEGFIIPGHYMSQVFQTCDNNGFKDSIRMPAVLSFFKILSIL